MAFRWLITRSNKLLRPIAALLLLVCLLLSGIAYGVSPAPLSSFVYPLLDTRISSSFGTRSHPVLHYVKHHNGIDLAAPDGAIIRSIGAGKVVFADPYAGYGKFVVVDHGSGITSHYGHCRTLRVNPGETVKAGQIIATVGRTGMVTGPHLHFEIRLNGEPQDPQKFVPGLTLEAEG